MSKERAKTESNAEHQAWEREKVVLTILPFLYQPLSPDGRLPASPDGAVDEAVKLADAYLSWRRLEREKQGQIGPLVQEAE